MGIDAIKNILNTAVGNVGDQAMQKQLAGKLNKIDIDGYLADVNKVEKINVAEYTAFKNLSHNGTIDTIC